MTTLSSILRHVALGRLLVLCLLVAPPSACTTASEHDDSAPLTRITERGPVELAVTIDSDRIEVGSPMTVELIATAHPEATVATPLVTIADDAMLGGFHVLDAQQRPDYPGVDGQRVWSQTLTLDTFTPGTLELPAFTISFEDRRGDFRMIGGSQVVADVVEQGADHGLLVGARFQRAGGGLQAMFVTVDGIAVGIALEAQQVLEHASAGIVLVVLEMRVDQCPVGAGAFIETGEGRLVHGLTP